MKLELSPLSLREANTFVARHHRHSVPPRGMKFAVAASVDGEVVAVAITGRPVARGLDDGWTLEVLRVCARPVGDDGGGYRNACSFLYGACWRAARALGYRKVVTYTRVGEPGASLKAAGWRVVGEVSARSWNTPSRPRVDRDERQERLRWEAA